jgi:3-oxocholest-4-en-26-oate---CoA ligase
MTAWNFATIWEIIAGNIPDAPALMQGDRTITWSEFDVRSEGLAQFLIRTGSEHEDKVALYLYNCPEYLEACFASFKAGLVPVNTNYRYADDELAYLWDNSDAVAVVFHGSFTEHVERVRERVPKVRTWVWVQDGTEPCPPWAVPYETAASETGSSPSITRRRDDDLLMIYTGGTTGMPKGVMWRQDDLVRGVIGASARRFRGPADYEEIARTLTRPGKISLPACPLMHATGWFSSLGRLTTAGSVALLTARHFHAHEVLDAWARHRVNSSAIVGDVIAKPILAALDDEPDRWDLSALTALSSSGVMWSTEVKQGLLRHLPHVQLIDNFGSSEAMGMGQSISTSANAVSTATFKVTENTRVLDEDGRDVRPGSSVVGRVAVRGHQPLGYYKDPEKSRRTFVMVDGDRYSIPGDYARVAADGTLILLGRGSVCINTGGEKVFPEEVEEALKLHPTVTDAVVVGIPDDRFGESVTAVVTLRDGETLDERGLIDHVKEHIAGYKAPKRVLQIDTIGRAANGKVDYVRLRRFALDRLAPAPSLI